MKKVKNVYRSFILDSTKIDLNDPNSVVSEIGSAISNVVAEIIQEAKLETMPLVDYSVKKPVSTGKPMEYNVEVEVIFSDD